MTKGELLKRLKDVPDSQELFVVSSEHNEDDDMFWGSSYETEIKEIKVGEAGDVYVVLEAEEFM